MKHRTIQSFTKKNFPREQKSFPFMDCRDVKSIQREELLFDTISYLFKSQRSFLKENLNL